MSVRRLADEAIQPAAFAFSNDNLAWAKRKIAEYPAGRQQSAVIPLLMRAQDQDGWITRAAIEAIADMLDMAYIRVLEVATFYTQFQLQPVGTRAHIQVCGTTPCMLRGAEQLREVCEHRIHPEPHHLNAEGTMSWEEVECLGACVNAPMVMIGQDTYEDLTVERFEAIVDAFAAGEGASIQPGPQIERVFSAAAGGQTTLLEVPGADRTYKAFPPPPPPAPAPGVPPAAPAPVDKPAATRPASDARRAAQKPTKPGRQRGAVPEEAAPALKDPAGAPKASVAAAEKARIDFDKAAKANGNPNRAMREDATGAESPAGKLDAGAAPGKAHGPSVSAGGARSKPRFAPAGGAVDDLKLISGVGPKLEQALHGVGITAWAQVAALTPEQIAALEGKLRFPGRVTRDRWIEQAEALAAGGVAEYVKRFGKDPR